MARFGARDLALFLPADQIGDNPYKVEDEINVNELNTFKPNLDPSKATKRYFKGQAPEWIDESKSVDYVLDKSHREEKVDRRLSRITEINPQANSEKRKRRIYEAEVIIDEEIPQTKQEVIDETYDKDIEQSDDDDIAKRRARVREKQSKTFQITQEMTMSKPSSEIVIKKESESEYETDTDASDDSEEYGVQLLRPVFVPKHHRETIKEQQLLLEKQAHAESQNKLHVEEKKQKARLEVANSLRKMDEKREMDMAATTEVDSDGGLPDDSDDPLHDEVEYQLWRVREIQRLKRESEIYEANLLEQQNLERRKAMTEEEKYQEDVLLGKFKEKEKKKWKFLQKYYHKGVFYMDEDSIAASKKGAVVKSSYEMDQNQSLPDARLREYDEPTLEDRYNREALPKVLQVKNFGKRGRTKYTHLVDQDTTVFQNNDNLTVDKNIMSKYLQKRSGVGGIEDLGRKRKN